MPVGGDLDGDGDLDLAGWATFGSAVATMTNDGDGFFVPGPSSTITALNNPQHYLLPHPFDVDGDGDADLYAARTIASSFGSAGNDVVLRNNGGSFSVAFNLSDNAPVEVIADLDADGDGDRDIILGRRAPASLSNGVAPPMLLLVNVGVGGFLPPIQLGGNHATYDLEIADFNGDGLDDIFQTNANANAGTIGGPEPCVLYLRTSPGAFTPNPQPAMTGYYSAAGDLNGDGLPDVVLDNQVWFNSGGTTFLAGPGLSQAIGSPPALADVDEDGDLDIVEAPAAVLNTGGGVFGPAAHRSPVLSGPADGLEGRPVDRRGPRSRRRSRRLWNGRLGPPELPSSGRVRRAPASGAARLAPTLGQPGLGSVAVRVGLDSELRLSALRQRAHRSRDRDPRPRRDIRASGQRDAGLREHPGHAACEPRARRSDPLLADGRHNASRLSNRLKTTILGY